MMLCTLDQAIERAKLPINIKRIPDGWKMTAPTELHRYRYDHDIRRMYLQLRTRLLNQSREDRLS